MLHSSLGIVDEESSSAGAGYFSVVSDSGAPGLFQRRESESVGGIPVSVISSAPSRESRSSIDEEHLALRSSIGNSNSSFMMGSSAPGNVTGATSAMNAPLFITASPLSTISAFPQMYLNPHTNQLMIVNASSIPQPQSQPLTPGLMLLQAPSHSQSAVQPRPSAVHSASAISQMPMPAIVGFPTYTAMTAGSSIIPSFVVRTPEGYFAAAAATGIPFHGGMSAQQFLTANGMVADQQAPPLPFASATSSPGNGTRYTPVLPRPQPGLFEQNVVEKRSVETQMCSKLQQGSNAPQSSTALNSPGVGPVSIEIPQRSTANQKDQFVAASTVISPAVSTKQEGSNVQTLAAEKSIFSLIDQIQIRTSPPSLSDAFDPHAQFMHEIQLNGAAKPQILTHVVEGFVIREAAEPFPISAFPFDEFVTDAMYDLSEPPQLEPAVRNAQIYY